MKRAGIERIKNAVIVFLLIITVALSVCAVFILLPDIGIGKNLTTEVSGSADSGYKISTGVSAEAARPFCIVVTDDSGEHYGVKYNSDDVDEAYNILSGSFGESIGSAKKEPQKISEEKWRYALMSPGAYFEYNDSVPLNVLAGWFGTETQKTWESFSVKRLCIIMSYGEVYLYFMDSGEGEFYYTKTATSADSLKARIGTFRSNKAQFAFENEKQLEIYPYIVLTQDSEPCSVSVSNPLKNSANLDAVVTALGANPRITPSYPGSSKSVIYVEHDFTIKINSDGSVVYRAAEEASQQEKDKEESLLVEAARDCAARAMELFASDAYVQFTGLQNEDDGTVSVYFDYFIDGCRVYAGNDGHGGTVVFENGQMTQMTLYFRTYVSTGIETELLREIQAAAAAGGSAKIGYSDNGADVIYPQWFVAQE